ncbi:hypothetical protein P4S64_01340 [Vibrio sp. M60_M31a]
MANFYILIRAGQLAELVAMLYLNLLNQSYPDNLCHYFPEPIQGWQGSTSTLNIQNPTQISGWSSEYLNDDTSIYELPTELARRR